MPCACKGKGSGLQPKNTVNRASNPYANGKKSSNGGKHIVRRIIK